MGKKKAIDKTPSVIDNVLSTITKFASKNKIFFLTLVIVIGVFLVIILNGIKIENKKKGKSFEIEGGISEWQKK